MNVDDMLEHSFVLTVDDSVYRLRDAEFEVRFHAQQLDSPLPRRFYGFQIKNGIYKQAGLIKTNDMCSCFLSHIAIVKSAQAMNWPFVCIFENDVIPCRKCREKLSYYLGRLPPEIGLLKLGHLGSLDGRVKDVDNDFIQIKTYGAHAYVVFERYYAEYIRLAKLDLHIDRLAMNQPEDGSIVVATKKMLFSQSFSAGINDNQKYKKLLFEQGFLEGFDLG